MLPPEALQRKTFDDAAEAHNLALFDALKARLAPEEGRLLIAYADARTEHEVAREDFILHTVATVLLDAGRVAEWRAIFRQLLDTLHLIGECGPTYEIGDELAHAGYLAKADAHLRAHGPFAAAN